MRSNLTHDEILAGLSEAAGTASVLGELTLSQLQVFLMVARHPNGIQGSQIADRLTISPANASRTLAILSDKQLKTRMSETLGLITYKPDRLDSRIKYAILTDKGEELSYRLAGSFVTQAQRLEEKKEWDGKLLKTKPEVRARSKNVDLMLDVLQLENAFAAQQGTTIQRLHEVSKTEGLQKIKNDWLGHFAIGGEQEAFDDMSEDMAEVVELYIKSVDHDVDPAGEEINNLINTAEQPEQGVKPTRFESLIVKIRRRCEHRIELSSRARRLIASKNQHLMVSPESLEKRPEYAGKIKEFLRLDLAQAQDGKQDI